ncbi:MAG TPA: hypothetical protein VEB39_06560, partial [Sphingomicrobium sp.]|nr:hypothetical protein [Sphingomicrobium sp.]
MAELADLLPELGEWNNGRGISPDDWLGTFIQSDQAIAYAQLIWPTFVEHESYILRGGFSLSALREWERKSGVERWQVEATLNTVRLDDLLFAN